MPSSVMRSTNGVSPEEHLRRINAFAVALLEAQDLDDLLWSIADHAGDILGFQDCVIYLREGDVLVQRAAYGIKSPEERKIFNLIEIPVGSGVVGAVAETGIAEIVQDTAADSRYIPDEFPGRSELTVPVLFEGKVIAVLDAEAEICGAFRDEDRAILQAVSNIAAARIASAMAVEEVERTQKALRDANDMLELRVAERTEELERTGGLLRVILRSIGDGIIAVDSQGRVVFMSSAAEFLTGWTAEQAIGSQLDQVYRVFSTPTGMDPVSWRDRPHDAEPIGVSEWVLEPSDTDRRLISEGMTAIHGSPGAGWVLVFRDVTEQRRLEEELRRTQQLESLGVLAGGIAHDFNNYLTIIRGNLEFLTLSPELESCEDLLKVVKRALQATGQAAGLPKQLMTLAKGGGPMKTEAVELASLVNNAVEFCLTGSNLTVQVELSPGLGRADVDGGQITQVLNNLLINAIQFMPDGGRLRIEASRKADESGQLWAVIAVEDEGPGIPQKMLERIFDPFYTTQDTGSGLGLTTAHSVVQRHGGFMKVFSEVGQGSRFEVWLQVSQAVPKKVESKVLSTRAGLGLQVLILDDEEGILDLLSKILIAKGHLPTCTASIEEALTQCSRVRDRGERFDVALLDVTLPGGGGGTLALTSLRQIQPFLPAVIMSGYSEKDELTNYEVQGFQGALIKPFKLSKVEEVLVKAIGAV